MTQLSLLTEKKQTQCSRVLTALQEAKQFGDGWIDGMLFLNSNHPITQFHARIFELERKGFQIEHGWVEGKDWKKYRLV